MIQAGIWQGTHTHTELLKNSLSLVLDVTGMRLRFGERPCFVLCLKFSLILCSHWSRQAPPAPPSHLKMWYLFSWCSGGGWCGPVAHYSSVKCCFWALDEQWVSADRVRKVIERCSSVHVLEGSVTFHQSPCFSILDTSAFLSLSSHLEPSHW